MIKHLFARFRQIHKQLPDLLRQRQSNAKSGRDFQRGVEILDLVFDDTSWREVPLDHPLAVQFKGFPIKPVPRKVTGAGGCKVMDAEHLSY